MVKVGHVPRVRLVASCPEAADSPLRRWRHAAAAAAVTVIIVVIAAVAVIIVVALVVVALVVVVVKQSVCRAAADVTSIVTS